MLHSGDAELLWSQVILIVMAANGSTRPNHLCIGNTIWKVKRYIGLQGLFPLNVMFSMSVQAGLYFAYASIHLTNWIQTGIW